MGYSATPPIGSVVPHQPTASFPYQPAVLGYVTPSQQPSLATSSVTRVTPAAVTVVRSLGPTQTAAMSSLGSAPLPAISVPNFTLPSLPAVSLATSAGMSNVWYYEE